MAQEEKSIIRSLADPTIKLEELSFADIDEGTSKTGETRGEKNQKQMGDNIPFVRVNGYTLFPDELIRFTIDCTGFLPLLSLQFILTGSTTFLSKNFPKDGDIVNVFIRGRNDLFKPIRNDYIITKVSSNGGVNSQSAGTTISISGYLNVPGIIDEVTLCKSGTSYEALQQIADDLGLGFASNETSTNDYQNWLCVRDSFNNFIPEIASCSWKDENSFFDVFVDVYYHLNFINVNNQFSNKTEIDDALLDVLMTHDAFEGDKISQAKAKKVFTNINDFSGTNMFINKFKLVNNSYSIANVYGYKMFAEFFEQNTLEKWEIFSEPLIVEGSEKDKILLKGRPNDDSYKNSVRKRWLGIQYTLPEHNVHEKHAFSMVHNLINNKELDKLQVHIEVPRANFNIYRGERIPCVIASSDDALKSKIMESGENVEGENSDTSKDSGTITIDKFYSGYYMIAGMIFSYTAFNNGPGQLTETVQLTRREWPTP